MGASDRSPSPDHTAQGSSSRKINPHNFWLEKPVGVGVAEGTAEFSGENLKGPHRLKTYANPPTLGFTIRATDGRVPVTYRKWVK